MTHIYIDESGSMTSRYSQHYPYFVVTLIVPKDKKKLKTVFKRFVSKKFKKLKELDTNNKMFKNGKFCELKGSCLDTETKIQFINYFCRNDLFEIYFIKINNKEICYGLFNNTARAFNYTLKLAIEKFLKLKLLPKDSYMLHIDERNEKTKTIYFLEEYLNTELHLANNLAEGFEVKYYDSSCNQLIQIADIFSNILYSCCFNKTYSGELSKLKEEGYIKGTYVFPSKT